MGFFGGLFVSLVFSPVIGLIAVIATKPSDDKIISSGEMKKCPDCAELVKNDALKCRYCGKAFDSGMKKEVPTEKKAPSIVEVKKEAPIQKKIPTISELLK